MDMFIKKIRGLCYVLHLKRGSNTAMTINYGNKVTFLSSFAEEREILKQTIFS